jgi:hypothetical protein
VKITNAIQDMAAKRKRNIAARRPDIMVSGPSFDRQVSTGYIGLVLAGKANGNNRPKVGDAWWDEQEQQNGKGSVFITGRCARR